MDLNVKKQLSNEASAARLTQLKKIEQNVSQTAAGNIIFSPALITRDGAPIIQKGTINIVQGRQGSHKSRLAELFCSLLLCPEGTSINYPIGFERVEDQQVMVVYIDTERNQKEEFPSAIKSILGKAGFNNPSQVSNFRFTSLKSSERSNRLDDLSLFLTDVRNDTSDPLFVLLDVVTDCLLSFNDLAETMKLLDYIGNLCENFDATFLLIIHENPGSDKARGHLGTESVNKSASVLHIGFEKGANGEYTELIMLKFIKQRHSKRLDPVPLTFSEDSMSLQLADPTLVKSITDQKREKAKVEDVATSLKDYLTPRMDQKELIGTLTARFGCSPQHNKNAVRGSSRKWSNNRK